MSKYDEQEIERLTGVCDNLRETVRKLEYQLGTAKVLISVAISEKADLMSIHIWENRKKQWMKEYEASRSN